METPVLRQRGGSGPSIDLVSMDDLGTRPSTPTAAEAGAGGSSHGLADALANTASLTPAAAANDSDADAATFAEAEAEMTEMYGGGSLTDPETYRRCEPPSKGELGSSPRVEDASCNHKETRRACNQANM